MDYKDPKPFRFKQFEVHHHLSTFKVNTDGVLLGCSVDTPQSKTALDIGTGTGMIALILAQKYPTLHITGIEIDKNSAAQAQYNAKQSPFAHRVDIINGDCFEYDYKQKFDLIVCNPPYFVGGTLPQDASLSVAKHSTGDFIPKLMQLVERLLVRGGVFTMILPLSVDKRVRAIIEDSNLSLHKHTLIRSYEHSEPYASIYKLSTENKKEITESLTLYIQNRDYTAEHYSLTKDLMLG